MIKYGLVMAGILIFLVRDNVIGAVAGVLVSGPLYLGFGAVLAKFGYRRKSMAELRDQRESVKASKARESSAADSSDPETPRKRPPPTSRTSGGSNRPAGKRRR